MPELQAPVKNIATQNHRDAFCSSALPASLSLMIFILCAALAKKMLVIGMVASVGAYFVLSILFVLGTIFACAAIFGRKLRK